MHVIRRASSGWRLGILAGGIAAAAGLSGAVLPATAAAATHHVVGIELFSNDLPVTTSTGHQVILDVHAYAKPHAVAGNELDVTLTQLNGAGGANGEEDHSWMFPIDSTAFTAKPSASGALVVKAATLGGFGQLNLAMTPTSKPSTQRCGGAAAAALSHVKLVGTLLFKTHSGGANKWGSVGSANAKKVFKFHGQLAQYYPGGEKCLSGGSLDLAPPCATTLQWDSGGMNVDLNGFDYPGGDIVEGSRFTLLHRPFEAMRMDDVVATVPRPTFLTAPDQLVTTSVNAMLGLIGQQPSSAGKALLVSSKAAKPAAVPCGSHGKTVNVTMWQATYKNGPTPLTLPADIFGAMRTGNNSDAMLLTTDTAQTPVPTTTPTPTATDTPSPTDTPTATDTPSPTDTPTATDTPTPTDTPTANAAPLTKQAALAQVERYVRSQRLARFRG